MKEIKEIRCLEHNFRMFAKVIKVDKKTNLIEVKCRECSKYYSERMKREIEVLHYYDITGGFVETRIINVTEEKVKKDVKSALKKEKIKLIKKEEENGSNNNNR